MDNKVILQVDGSIATVKLNRPEVLNALDSGMWAGLERAALSIMSQPKINVVILTGVGDRLCQEYWSAESGISPRSPGASSQLACARLCPL